MNFAKPQVALATSIPNLPPSQSQKDIAVEESSSRFESNRRVNMKGKHLTRSHAMRESTSPPRTPTPRTEHGSVCSPNGQTSNYQSNMYSQHHDGNENVSNNNHNKIRSQRVTTNRGNSPITDSPVVIVTSQHKQQQQNLQPQNVVLCNETEFPKLSPPKTNKLQNLDLIGNTQQQQQSFRNNSFISNNAGDGGNLSVENGSANDIKSGCNTKSNMKSANSETNNSNNCNNNGTSFKKIIVDLKSCAMGIEQSLHKKNMHSQNHFNNPKQNAQFQQQYGSKAGNTYHQSGNIVETQQIHQNKQMQHNTAQSPNPVGGKVSNSTMNFQLIENDVQQQPQNRQNSYEKEKTCTRNESQSSNISTSYDEDSQTQQHHYDRNGGSCGVAAYSGNCSSGNISSNNNKKNRSTPNSKGTKPRLKNIGGCSSSSLDNTTSSNNTSGFISRENSCEQFTDYGGTDLLSFFKETLNRTSKDRIFLLKTEKELIDLVQDKSRSDYRFPPNTSYNRMLLHRTAAFFGMEHNIDSESQQCVIVNVTANTRIPDVRFKSLVRDREDTRKSILKRDTHSFDEPRQSSYLCPDRGMLDRRAKSFEEREEDYERARSRIFCRTLNDSCDSFDENNTNVSWSSTTDQQQQQAQHQRSRNLNGKLPKIHDINENRSVGSIPKAHNFANYVGPPTSVGSQLANSRSDSTKNADSRSLSKIDSTNTNSCQWRLSPSNSGTLYHFDPSNLQSTSQPAEKTDSHHISQTTNFPSNAQPHSPPQVKSKGGNLQCDKNAPQKNSENNSGSIEGESRSQSTDETATSETVEVTKSETEGNQTEREGIDSLKKDNLDYKAQTTTDECDNVTEKCLSVTTTTHTKNYDRIEIQKFKHQATSPNIPSAKENMHCRETSVSSSSPEQRDGDVASRNQQLIGQTPLSSRSTPYSSADHNTKSNAAAAAEESKPATWTYTTSYQAPDGSTVFHTTATPTTSPYCSTTYQQAPDGSIYAVPQGVVYAYPQQVEGDVQGYFMPVFDGNAQRSDGATLISTGTQAIYPTNGGTATVMPIAATFPAAQFASGGTPIYSTGQLIYASDQFTANGSALTATTPPQQMPLSTYPIGYPYNSGFWGQNVTYYVPQQTIGNALTGTPLMPTSSQPPVPPVGTNGATTGGNVAGGVTLTNLTPTAAGPPSNSQISLTNGTVPINTGNNQTTYQALSGTTYFGTGRIKRPSHSHFQNAQQSNHHNQVAATMPGSGGPTTAYQLGHAVPTITLATAGNVFAGTTDMSTVNAQTATPMYALPQHATIFPANLYSYSTQGASANAAGTTPQAHSTPSATPAAMPSCVTAHGVMHAQQNRTVISNPPFYASHPHVSAPTGALHTAGPAAIPIIDPATLKTTQITANGNVATYSTQPTPTTPHSLPTHITRNAQLFSTPPNTTSSGNSTLYNNSSTPHYYGHPLNADNHLTTAASLVNSPQNNYAGSSNDKRNSNMVKKSTNSGPSNIVRQNSTNCYAPPHGKSPLLSAAETPRASPNTNNAGYYNQSQRSYIMNKRNIEKAPQQISIPTGTYVSSSGNTSNYNAQQHHTVDITSNKPPIRLNAAAASFRQKSVAVGAGGATNTDYRRSISQRNSPATNSGSNDTSVNNSPNSVGGTSSSSTATAPNTPLGASFLSNGSSIYNGTNETQQHAQVTPAPYIQRGSYIPATIQQQNNISANTVVGGSMCTASQQPATSTTVLSSTVAATTTIGAYNPATASGVYFKYGQTYFAHPSIALPNSRRSPSTDVRPPMTQMTGMYPTVNMMIPGMNAPVRHAQGRNLNYRGTRPPR